MYNTIAKEQMNNLPPIPQLDLTTFQHPLAKPYRFFAFDFEVYEEDTLLCLFDCATGEWERYGVPMR